MTVDTAAATDEQAGLARKRRMHRLHRDVKRQCAEEEEYAEVPEAVSSDPKPHPTGIKLQARYDPGVPMTRDELTSWRKEARRVRNRESAAESRKRTRDRIEELESEVSALNTKYQAALARIMELESRGDSSTPLFVPRNISQEKTLVRGKDSRSVFVSPCPSEVSSPCLSPVSNRLPSRFSLSDRNSHQELVDQKYQNIMTMISRPAVKSIHDDDTFEPLAPDASSSLTETTTFETASDLSSNSEDLEETELGDFLMDAFSSYEDQFPLVVDADLDAFLGDMVGV